MVHAIAISSELNVRADVPSGITRRHTRLRAAKYDCVLTKRGLLDHANLRDAIVGGQVVMIACRRGAREVLRGEATLPTKCNDLMIDFSIPVHIFDLEVVCKIARHD